MPWICYTNCEDGTRNALPIEKAEISYDRRLLDLRRADVLRSLETLQSQASQIRDFSVAFDADDSTPVPAMLADIEKRMQQAQNQTAAIHKRFALAVALINGCPAREIVPVDSLQDVEAYTRGSSDTNPSPA